jgi:hypothetical protein
MIPDGGYSILDGMAQRRASFSMGLNALAHGGSLSFGSGTAKSMDEDLQQFSREELVAEVEKLRAGIRAHRDGSKHELCWHHPQLWGLLPEQVEPDLAVPAWPQFLRGCLKYRESLDAQLSDAPRVSDEYGGEKP